MLFQICSVFSPFSCLVTVGMVEHLVFHSDKGGIGSGGPVYILCDVIWHVSQVVRFRHVHRSEDQNVLRIVPIFTIDNNHYLALGFIILARLAQFEFWTLCVKMGGKKWQMFNIQTRKYVIRRSV